MRLDTYLVENAFVQSRTKAQDIIKKSLVSVDKKLVKKSSFIVDKDSLVEVAQHESYVSRAAYKLKYFLEELDLDLSDNICLDIGASTGGFTQVLLQRDVKSVDAVDVGKGQLHKSLLEDARVNSYESCDIRDFKSSNKYDLVVSDVSFISLLNILDDVDRLAACNIILLFKPQFEVGREIKRDKHGVVQNEKAILKAMEVFENKCEEKGWTLEKMSPSKITGKEGNLEYCHYFKK